jgi:hypothetical protein
MLLRIGLWDFNHRLLRPKAAELHHRAQSHEKYSGKTALFEHQTALEKMCINVRRDAQAMGDNSRNSRWPTIGSTEE